MVNLKSKELNKGNEIMANYESLVLSNTFEVTEASVDNVQRAVEYFSDSYVDLEKRHVIIGSYEGNYSDSLMVVRHKTSKEVVKTYDSDYEELEEILIEELGEGTNIESFEEISFDEFIQESLTDNSYAFIKEIGNEKLRYVVACGVLITKKSITWLDLDQMAEKIIKGENNDSI